MDGIVCPHCSAMNGLDSSFCESCGKALPTQEPAGPRIVTGADMATTEAGQELQSRELAKQARKAAGALLAVAILQAIFGTIILFGMGAFADDAPDNGINAAVIGSVYGIAVVFFALYLWARKSPLPAAIVGLVVFVSLHSFEAVVDPTSLGRGIIVKIIIIVVLVKAIQAGIQYRKLSQESAGGPM